MELHKIIKLLDAVVIPDTDDSEVDIQWAYSSDLMSDVLFFAAADCILITGLTQPQVIRTAEIADIKTVVFVQNKNPDKETVELAKKKKIPLLVTPLSKFAACGKLYTEGLRDCPKKQ